ncbi:MAG: hypothetical protein B7Y25_01095 [Alphaproteobacteria bacterium 16-39-46]|nr:MAG: hypothetical protein B7Y25_01095 [Alphaproteobacteria bacterium 16-39-46]
MSPLFRTLKKSLPLSQSGNVQNRRFDHIVDIFSALKGVFERLRIKSSFFKGNRVSFQENSEALS